MTLSMALVFGILVVTIILFATEKLPLDVVALLAMLALMLTGLLTPAEALAGFADPVVIMVAGLFVVGAGLVRTGVAENLSTWIGRVAGPHPIRLLVGIMVAVGILSAFMSTTGATAIFLPIVVSLAWNARLNPSKLVMPLAFASLIGGLITLIGTPPNIIVSNQLAAAGFQPFGFFDFTPVGVAMLMLGVGFMVLIGRHVLPDRAPQSAEFTRGGELDGLSMEDLLKAYQLPGQLTRLRVEPSSPLVGKSLADADLRARYHVNVLEVQSEPAGRAGAPSARTATPSLVIRHNDILQVKGKPENVARLATEERLSPCTMTAEGNRCFMSPDAGIAEVILTPRSSLIGHTLKDVRFRDRYGVTVVSIMRRGELVPSYVSVTPLRFGDALLVEGEWEKIELLRNERKDFVVVGLPRERLQKLTMTRRAPLALAVMAGMLVLFALNILPTVTTVLLAALAMVLLGCIRMEEAYSAINWQGVILIAAMLPLSTAMQKTGAAHLIAVELTNSLQNFGPLVVMAVLFLITNFLSLFISNTATTVLVAPIAIQTAISLGVAPYPFLMGIAVAASTAFATPISTPSNTMILGPGGYRFMDYVKVGLPLQIVLFAGTLVLVPALFPF